MDHHFAGLFQLGDNAIQRVPALTNAKVPFDFSAFSGFQPFQFLVPFGFFRICERFPEFRPIQVNPKLFAVSQVLSGTEDRISQYPGRVVFRGSSLAFLVFIILTAAAGIVIIVMLFIFCLSTNDPVIDP